MSIKVHLLRRQTKRVSLFAELIFKDMAVRIVYETLGAILPDFRTMSMT